MVRLNFPMVSQRTTVTGDGKPSENANQDCVAASIDALCRYLLGKPENSVFNPDDFKDAAEGQNYVGGTSAEAYIPFCKSLGIDLYAVTAGSSTSLITLAHSLLSQERAVIFTEIDPYVDTSLDKYKDWTHVCVWYADDSSGLTAMDPWLAQPVYKSDTTWASLLKSNQLWLAERINDMPPPLTLTNPEAAKHFDQISNTQWKCKQTGKILKDGMLKYYCSCSANPLQGLHDLGLPVSNEIPLDGKGNTRQHFERGVLFWDPQKIYDNPPGSGPVYVAKIYSGQGQDPEIADLQKQIDQLKQQPAMPQMEAVLKQVKTLVADF